jgi:predicted  nucleic acid-binding Zn-ribbon protein
MSSSEKQERNESFLENEVKVLTSRVKALEYECADLTVHRDDLSERVKKLASRQPAWPKGYRPQRRHNSNQSR